MAQATLVFTVSSSPAPLVITNPPSWVNVPVGTTVTHLLQAAGGVTPYTWAITPTPGLSIDQTGLLTWTPQSVGTFQVTVTVTDSE